MKRFSGRANPGIRVTALGFMLAALTGCATYPVSKNLRQQAGKATLAQVLENPETHQGQLVIWGGRIIKTANETNGADLYVLKLPLSHRGKPRFDANSPGRFIARCNRFLDPQVFKQGRLVTVAGKITGLKTEKLQKTQYTYPVLASEELHLWPRARRIYYYPVWGGGWGPYYPGWVWGYYPMRGLSWGWYYPYWNYYYPGDFD